MQNVYYIMQNIFVANLHFFCEYFNLLSTQLCPDTLTYN